MRAETYALLLERANAQLLELDKLRRFCNARAEELGFETDEERVAAGALVAAMIDSVDDVEVDDEEYIPGALQLYI